MIEKPNFERFSLALSICEPDRVPLSELHVDQEIKEAFLGHSIENAADEVDFWCKAGYDYVLINIPGQDPARKRTANVTDRSASLRRSRTLR